MDTGVITTAVVLAAGRGTRRLPATRVLDKAMLPIGNRPVVDYVIEQCAMAGIRRIVMVVNSAGGLISQHYGKTVDIATEYPQLGIHGAIAMEYVVQPAGGYGTASAVACVEAIVHDDRFVVIPADAFIYNPTQPALGRIIDAIHTSDVRGAVGGLVLDGGEVSKYSVITKENGHLTGLIEKPQGLDVNARYEANMSYYVLPQEIFDAIRSLTPTNNEYYLTDAVVAVAMKSPIVVVPVEGEYLDSGQLDSWVRANGQLSQ